ncbi:hypothetical protein P154DRAFT_596918 [Amniculicola lignicola CBS 123094]|uniref:Protein kinase domain-containing protein n=1 Tax=Amniculicola lignicola CBS 123094 TaxID=1392246 RepID=A0A6A5WHI8_9PLEO|nr:hypothetical protein P154DRAFT_596918 [Amniculicola lignicola CBS 123094]
MTGLSRSQIIQSEPIGDGLDAFHQFSKLNYKDLSASRVLDLSSQGLKDFAVHLIIALQALPVARLLPSIASRGTLRSDLLRLELSTESDEFDLERIIPFLRALRSTSSFANSTKHRKYVDNVLKEELGPIYVGVPGFFEAFFGEIASLELAAQAVFKRCKEGDNLLYQEEGGWQDWPQGAREQDILSWFAELTGQFLDYTEDFVDNPDASIDSKWRYAREVLAAQDSHRFVLSFTLWGITSTRFNINQEGLRFVSAVLGERYIEIKRHGKKERLIINKVMKRAPCIAGRATTYWKAHREDDDSQMPLVIKDSWQYPERKEEGELLRKATDKGMTVRVCNQDNEIRRNWSSSCTDAPLPPSKRTYSSSPTKGRTSTVLLNRIHRRVIVCDYGKAIYKANSRTSLLAALEGCIEGYESLHTRAGLLQCDISPNNLMMNEEDDNPSWRAFLIDLDLAIKEQREKFSGARGKTGTRAFMAIGVLLDDKNHSFMHDLESFFWVLFWICVHYDGPGKAIGATEFECWNYESDQKLAESKLGLVSIERQFLNRITKAFTPYYQPLIPHVNRLRRVVFPMNNPWENEDRTLYFRMKEILRKAQKDLEDLGKSQQKDR